MDRRLRSGFTVLELLCVLGVFSVLLAIALPRAAAILPRLTLDQAARQLASDLELARVEAINRNARMRAVVELGAARYQLETETESGFEPDGAPRKLPGGVRFDAGASTRVSAGSVSITFLPRGHTADNATIALAAAEDIERVIVSASGRVRVE
jgi:type IV fimbrial biogenesis protein FimT